MMNFRHHLKVRHMISRYRFGGVFLLILPEASKKSKAKKLAKALDTKE